MYDVVYSVVVPGVVGGCAGLVSHIITHKKFLEFPQKYKKKWDLGFLADIIIGGSAAIFAVNYLITTNDTLRSIIGISILAGISGETVLLRRSLHRYEEKESLGKDVDNRLNFEKVSEFIKDETEEKKDK